MADLKTKQTTTSVADFIAAVPDETRRKDAETLCAMMERLTGDPPAMWGPSIIGFGRYRYTYESGHTGEMCRIGFSPRKAELVIYVLDGNADQREVLDRLGKHKTGKGCLYIKKLADVDVSVLEAIVQAKIERMAEAYPA